MVYDEEHMQSNVFVFRLVGNVIKLYKQLIYGIDKGAFLWR
jgi:hypothetical protein